MARYAADGRRLPTDIWEAAIWHYGVQVNCSYCPHATVFEAVGLWWLFERRGWPMNFRPARRHFYCGQCFRPGVKHRPRLIEAVNAESQRTLPRPSEQEWKRAVRRFRC